MEGLSPSDAILYPVMTGGMLAGLYFLIKWLNDPEIINKIMNWYLSFFGVFSISRLLSDSWTTVGSFVFPARYRYDEVVWKINSRTRSVAIKHSDPVVIKTMRPRRSPLPGVWSRLPLPQLINQTLWFLRELPHKPLFNFDVYLHDIVEGKGSITPQAVTSFATALAAVLYFNLVDKPWWLTNLLGFCFSYTTLQMMSPTTFWTGTLVLTSLFFYDIYFVFFTPMMITVATKLDIPVKLLFPRPPEEVEGQIVQRLAMLGLGDIVLPGLMIGLALRFDLYLFYLKKQRRNDPKEDGKKALQSFTSTNKSTSLSLPLVYDSTGLGRAEYLPASGGWGERFWLRKSALELEGGSFPKHYFHASLVGYIIGMLCTLGVMHVFKHGQPALLYLVPGVLISLWGTAWVRGETKMMWEYSENIEEEAKKKKVDASEKKKKAAKHNNGDSTHLKEADQAMGSVMQGITEEANDGVGQTTTSEANGKESKKIVSTADKSTSTEKKLTTSSAKQTPENRIVSFTLSLPSSSNRRHSSNSTRIKLSTPLEKEVQTVGSPAAVNTFETDGSSQSSNDAWEDENENDSGRSIGKSKRNESDSGGRSVERDDMSIRGIEMGPPGKRQRVA